MLVYRDENLTIITFSPAVHFGGKSVGPPVDGSGGQNIDISLGFSSFLVDLGGPSFSPAVHFGGKSVGAPVDCASHSVTFVKFAS